MAVPTPQVSRSLAGTAIDFAPGIVLAAVGAGYAVFEPVGNTAVIVKLFRVFLLLPVVLGIGWYFTRQGAKHGEARVPVFVLVFLALCLVNSALPLAPTVAPVAVPVKLVLIELSSWGLLIALGALGLGTSISTIVALGWRHIATVLATSAVIFAIITGRLLLEKFI